MRVKRTLAVAAASAAVAVGSVASVGLPAASAQAATASVSLPISQFSHMLLDPAHHHIFISSGTASGGIFIPGSAPSSFILVTDYSGQTVATIPNEAGATGLALSSDGSTVYAALPNAGAISAISTSTLTETARYATGTNTEPTYVAYTSGRLWFGYTGSATVDSGIGSIDPSTNPATITLNATNDPYHTWYAAPNLAASPNGALVAGEPETVPLQLASYDVSSGTPTVLTPSTVFNNDNSPVSMQITPDGKDVVISNLIFQVSNLSTVGDYPTSGFPGAVSIADNGTVAVDTNGGSNSSSEVFLFAPGGSTPLHTYTFGYYQSAAANGTAITPDGSELFVITRPVSTSPYSTPAPVLNIVPDPAQGSSTLSVTGPATARKDQAITLTGTLGGTSPYAGGQTLTVTRIDPSNPAGVALPDVTTAADGTFTITDTPPKFNGDTGTVTYQVSYAGDAYLTSSTASASVTVRSDNS